MNSSEHAAHPPSLAVARRPSLPAWVMSLVVHVVFLLAIALLWQAPRIALREEPDRGGGIVLVQRDAEQNVAYFHDAESERPGENDASNQAADAARETLAALPAATEGESLELGEFALPQLGDLPASLDGLLDSPAIHSGGRPQLPTGTDVAAILAEDAARQAAREPKGSPTQVSLFGSPAAVGRSFVFVIDRSSSMGVQGLGALAASEAHLLAALDNLTDEHQFQIVVYDDRPFYFDRRGLLAATDENKAKAREFLAALSARGKTDHDLALRSALRMQPDVIFLLADGGDPYLNDGQQRAIQRMASPGTAIHCIQFGFGPLQEEYPFMRRLAELNRGQFVYVDMRGIRP